MGLQIVSAHITTYGERVVDVFYVKDVFGLKVEQPQKLAKLQDRLMEVVTPLPDTPAPEERRVAAAE